MVSALTTKTKHQYYLANGACIEYALSPSSSLIDVVDGLALDYFNKSGLFPLELSVWMQPKWVSLFNKECSSRFAMVTRNLASPTGMQIMRMETVAGPAVILISPDSEFPIFVGSEQELKDNSFRASMDQVLGEQ